MDEIHLSTEAKGVDDISSGGSVVWEDSLGSDSINEKGFSTTTTCSVNL